MINTAFIQIYVDPIESSKYTSGSGRVTLGDSEACLWFEKMSIIFFQKVFYWNFGKDFKSIK
jgi:hypothetical protein